MTHITSQSNPLCIGVVAGELSGDLLGGALIKVFKQQYPNARFIGIGGPAMQAEGLESLYELERLSIMGFIEPLKRLPELIAMRNGLIDRFKKEPIDLFVGIDAPDFNLRVAEPLRESGFKTVQYVSPSVWAWRQGRVHWIRRAVDLVLCLLPFEPDFYNKHDVNAIFVGHPMADEMPLRAVDTHVAGQLSEDGKAIDIDGERKDLLRLQQRLDMKAPRVALLPGSRTKEVTRMLPVFLETASKIRQAYSEAEFILPVASAHLKEHIEPLVKNYSWVQAVQMPARQVLADCDAALATSGTVTLESLLAKCPPVVAYRVDWFSYLLARWLIRVDHFSLVNLLAKETLVVERFQADANPDRLCADILRLIEHTQERGNIIRRFYQIHNRLRQQASEKAATALGKLISAND